MDENLDVTLKYKDKEIKTDSKTMDEVAKGLKDGSIKLPSELKEEAQEDLEEKGLMEDQPLFGEDDLIINTLEAEKREVDAEITKARKTIINKQVEIKDLSERRKNLVASIGVIRERHLSDEDKEDEEIQEESIDENEKNPK